MVDINSTSVGSQILLDDIGPNASANVKIDFQNLADKFSLKIISVSNLPLMLVIHEQSITTNCSDDVDYALFNNGSSNEFRICDVPDSDDAKTISKTVYVSEGGLRIFKRDQGNSSLKFSFTATVASQGRKCLFNEFECGTGHCIWSGFKRDGVNNCGEISDENYGFPSFCAARAIFKLPHILLLIALILLAFFILVAAFVVYLLLKKMNKRSHSCTNAALNSQVVSLPTSIYSPAVHSSKSEQLEPADVFPRPRITRSLEDSPQLLPTKSEPVMSLRERASSEHDVHLNSISTMDRFSEFFGKKHKLSKFADAASDPKEDKDSEKEEK
ncbi:uncharacterized protein CDAR_488321 [Caerostris darwini]|uniref:Uncharacterized protein n=1 Tax=Caerostris darwini TaxID=1538125 RepID=A0AAV4PXQ9_9ARAC|nr:uncharacterized protein CDAR_488321 [Caerostris darwini]